MKNLISLSILFLGVNLFALDNFKHQFGFQYQYSTYNPYSYNIFKSKENLSSDSYFIGLNNNKTGYLKFNYNYLNSDKKFGVYFSYYNFSLNKASVSLFRNYYFQRSGVIYQAPVYLQPNLPAIDRSEGKLNFYKYLSISDKTFALGGGIRNLNIFHNESIYFNTYYYDYNRTWGPNLSLKSSVLFFNKLSLNFDFDLFATIGKRIFETANLNYIGYKL